MCSAAWTFDEGGYQLGFNRDEKWARPVSRDPQYEGQHLVPGACARDSEAGGTWLFTNEYGVTLAVMNAYPGGMIPLPGKTSRGLLPLVAAVHATADRIEEALFTETEWGHFAPCELLLIDHEGLRHFGWVGESFTSMPAPAANFLTTSSVATEAVKTARHSRFDRIASSGVTAILNDDTANDPAAAIFVTRDDGGTVSQTLVTVSVREIIFASRRRDEPLQEIRFPRKP
jgi:hypothetical protein